MFLSDDEDYLPPNKRSKNTEAAPEAASTGKRKAREFNFGKKKNSRFISLWFVSSRGIRQFHSAGVRHASAWSVFLSVDLLCKKIRLNVLLNWRMTSIRSGMCPDGLPWYALWAVKATSKSVVLSSMFSSSQMHKLLSQDCPCVQQLYAVKQGFPFNPINSGLYLSDSYGRVAVDPLSCSSAENAVACSLSWAENKMLMCWCLIQFSREYTVGIG